MPAQGRGAFLVPRTAPRPAPRRQPAPLPPGLAQVIHHAVTQAAQVTHPAVVAAQHVAAQTPSIVRHANAPAVRAQKALKAPLSHTRGEVSDGLLRATIMQNPLLRANLEGDLNAAQLNWHAQVRQVAQQEAEAARKAKGGQALDLGFVNLTPLATTIATGAQKLGIGQALGGIPGKVLNEAIDLPGQALLSGADALSASYQAGEALGSGGRRGSYAPGEQLLGGIAHTFIHPLKSAEEAPLSTALMFGGAESALGRLAGRAGRAGEIVDKLDTGQRLLRREGAIPAFSRERPDLQLYGDLVKQQRYNADPLRKAGQVALEKYRARGGADPFQARGRQLQREVSGGSVKPGRIDYMRQAGERTRRQFVNTVKQAALQMAPERGRDAVPLIIQGIVRTPETLVADLQKERAKLEAAVQGEHGLTSAQVAQNRANLGRVDGLLSDEAFLHDPSGAFAASARLRAVLKPLEAILVHGGVLAPEQLKAKLAPYAQAHMGALVDGEGLPLSADGKPLSPSEIYAHMHANGVEDVGFMSHKPGQDAGGSFYQATTRLPGVERFHRTGSAFEKGLADHSWEALVGSTASKASRAAQLEVRARELSQTALAPKDGGFASRDAARKFDASKGFAPDGTKLPDGLGDLVPVHLGPQEINDAGIVNPHALGPVLRQFGLHNEKSLVSEQQGEWGLIPKEVQKRQLAHDKAIEAHSNIARGAQAYQNAFRAAKLNTSTRHIFGVAAEQAIRLGAEGVAPALRIPEQLRLPRGKSVSTGALGGRVIGGRAARAGAKFDAALKDAAQTDTHGLLLDHAGPLGAPLRELEAQLGTRGGQVQGYKDQRAIRAARQWSDTSRTAQVAKAGEHVMHETLPGRAALKTWHGWSAIVEGSLAKIEHGTHYAMLGKALKDTGFIDNYREVLKAQDQAMHDMVAGRLTSTQADAVARKVDDMMGNWSHLTPDVRRAVAYVTPFGLWWLNSMRWLYRLPVTHPIKTGILAAVYSATKQARNAEGQGFDAPSAVPDWLQGTIGVNIPGLGPGHINPTYYSPGGIGGPDFWKTAIEQIAPQFAGPVLAGLGLNPLSLDKLKNAQGAELGVGAKGANVLAELLTGWVPGATQAQQALQSGGKPYGTANILTDLLQRAGGPAQTKPGTQRPLAQVIEKMLLPERYAYDTGGAAAAAHGAATPVSALPPTQRHEVERAEQQARAYEESPVVKAEIRRAEEAAERAGK